MSAGRRKDAGDRKVRTRSWTPRRANMMGVEDEKYVNEDDNWKIINEFLRWSMLLFHSAAPRS